MDGCDVCGVTSRVPSISVLGERTQLSSGRLVTYGSNVGAGGGCCFVFSGGSYAKVG